jgi:hypothetical protein
MSQVVRKRSGILPIIRELVPRRMPEHMRVYREWKLRGLAGSLDHS